MLRYATACLLVILVSLGGLWGCKSSPPPIASANDPSAQAFYNFVLRYYANERARLLSVYGRRPRTSYVAWDVRITVKKVLMTDATHAVVVYDVTERWDADTWRAEGQQSASSHWEKQNGHWRIVSVHKGIPVTKRWQTDDP